MNLKNECAHLSTKLYLYCTICVVVIVGSLLFLSYRFGCSWRFYLRFVVIFVVVSKASVLVFFLQLPGLSFASSVVVVIVCTIPIVVVIVVVCSIPIVVVVIVCTIPIVVVVVVGRSFASSVCCTIPVVVVIVVVCSIPIVVVVIVYSIPIVVVVIVYSILIVVVVGRPLLLSYQFGFSTGRSFANSRSG